MSETVAIRGKDTNGKWKTLEYDKKSVYHTKMSDAQKVFRAHLAEGKSAEEFVLPAEFVRSEPESAPAAEAAAPAVPPTPFSAPKIDRFDIMKLELPTNGGCSFVLIGSTRCGKTTAIIELVKHFFKNHIKTLMTYSTQCDIYQPFRKTCAICPGFCPQVLQDAMAINRGTKNKYDFLHIMDDLSMAGKHDELMVRLLATGRNQGQSVIISGQRQQMLNPTCRANCNYVCLFKQNTDNAIKDVIETFLRSYLPMGMPMLEAIRYYRDMTADHSFFFINTLEDKAYLCKISL